MWELKTSCFMEIEAIVECVPIAQSIRNRKNYSMYVSLK